MNMRAFSLFGEIGIDDKQYTTAMNRLERETKQTGRTLERTWDKTTGDMDRVTNRTAGRIGGLATAVGRLAVPVAAAAGAIYAARGLWNGLRSVAESANNAANAQYSFRRQLQRSNVDLNEGNAVVQRLAERFKVLPETIMEASTVMLRAGGDMEDVERVLTAAGASALAAGFDVTRAMNNVSVATATGRSELLETSGIITNLGPVTQDYAESIGKTVDQLTEAEIIQARVNAIYAESEAEIEDIDQRMSGLAGVQGESNAKWVELGRTIGRVVLPLVIKLTEWWGNLAGGLTNFVNKAVTAWANFTKPTETAIGRVRDAAEAIGKAEDKESLIGVAHELAKELRGPAKQAFITLAEQAVASAKDVNEATEEMTKAWARARNTAQIARTEMALEIARTRLEIAEEAARAAEEGGAAVLAETIREAEANLRELEENGLATYAEVIEASNELNRLRQAQVGANRGLRDFAGEAEAARAKVEELEDQLEQLTGEQVELEVTVVPDPNNPNATDDNPTGLPTDGEVIDVTINARVNVAGALPIPDPGATANVAAPIAIPDPGATGGVNQGRHTRIRQRRARIRWNETWGNPEWVAAFNEGMIPFIPETNIPVPNVTANVPGAAPIPVPGVSANVPGAVPIPIPGVTANVPGGIDVGITPTAGMRTDPLPAHAEEQARENAIKYRQKLIEQLTTVTSSDGPLQGFGKTLLDVAAEKVPLFGAAIEGFVTGGPIGALTGVFAELLGRSEAFKNILGLLNSILNPIVQIFDALFTALQPFFEIVVSLVHGALSPLVSIIEHIVAPVLTAVASVIKGVYNGIARAINWALGWLGVHIPLIGEGDGGGQGKIAELEAERQELMEERRNATDEGRIAEINQRIAWIDGELARLRGLGVEDPATPGDPGTSPNDVPEVDFGSVPHAVQLAVATPLVEAVNSFLEGVMDFKSIWTGVGDNPVATFGGAVDRFGSWVDRLTGEGITLRFDGGGSTPGTVPTAHLR